MTGSRFIKNLRWGVVYGLFFACAYSLIALLIYAFRGSAPFDANEVTLGSTLVVYVGGGLVGGVIVGLLRPLAKWEAGATLVGLLPRSRRRWAACGPWTALHRTGVAKISGVYLRGRPAGRVRWLEVLV